jgi:hypothetical protein
MIKNFLFIPMNVSKRFNILSLCGMVCGVFALVLLAFSTSPAEALSVAWQGNLDSERRQLGKKLFAVSQVQATVEYHTKVFNSSSGIQYGNNITVAQGDNLTFTFEEHKKQDISYFVVGGGYGSPYGTWINGAGSDSQLCTSPNRMSGAGGRENRNAYGHYYVDPPSKEINGLESQSCSSAGNDGLDCTMDNPGTYTVTMQFNETAGRFWVAIGPSRGPGTGSICNFGPYARVLNVPTQEIVYTIQVNPDSGQNNGPQNPSPSLLGDGACVVGEPVNISMSTTDSDNDKVRFEIDWDPESAPDQVTEWKNSGETATVSRTYATEGEKTVRVRAQDEKSAYSGWESVTFICNNASDDTNDDSGSESVIIFGYLSGGLGIPSPDLTLSAIPSLVRVGQTTRVNWEATNVNSCTVTGDNTDSWVGLTSPVGGRISSPISGRVVYTLLCIDLNDGPISKTATVNIAPTFQEI